MTTNNHRQHQPAASIDALLPLIQMRGVTKTYASGGRPVQALKDLDLSIDAGEFVCIFGKSGAGKTTLINMITGVDDLATGEVIVGGVSVHSLSETDMAQWRGQNLGVIYQSFHLMPTLTLLQNVMLPMDFCGQYHPLRSPRRAMDLLCQVELEEHMHKPPSKISGGQQQRVAIARALANDPPIIVADEPTGRLDSVTAETIFSIFEALVHQGKTVVMVTHDESFAHRVSRSIHLADGRIVSDSKLDGRAA
jgi:putative ABC transport system ATP-binding protein